MKTELSVGDLAIVVRACSCKYRDPDLGRIYAVQSLFPSCLMYCTHCEAPYTSACWVRMDDRTFPIEWLRRIPPARELKEEERDVELVA